MLAQHGSGQRLFAASVEKERGVPAARNFPIPGWAMSANIGFRGEQRQSSSRSWRKVWYAPQHTPNSSNCLATSARLLIVIHCPMRAASASRALNRSPSLDRSTSNARSIPSKCSAIPVAPTRARHCLRLIATTMIRRPSEVGKSRPNAPYMSFPIGGRSSYNICA